MKVSIFEVGPRDGLQNEPKQIEVRDKIWFVRELVKCGLRDLEVGAFVRPDKVPQMKDSDLILKKLSLKKNEGRYWSLVPNMKGFERALKSGTRNIAVFAAATNTFSQQNIGSSISESFVRIAPVIKEARKYKIKVRGYVSVAFGCPFEGKVPPSRTLKVIEVLMGLGVFQVSIGDTIGVATPKQIEAVMKPAIEAFGSKKLAGHFHDTRGTALANTLRSMDLGLRTFDASAGGLGGCPFAPGATGNLATEDLVYMLNGMGVRTGVDLDLLSKVSFLMSKKMKRSIKSRYLAAYVSKKK